MDGYAGLHFEDERQAWPRARRAGGALLGAIAALALVVSLVYVGFVACTVPAATQALSRATCQDEASPYTADELVGLALAGRDYAFGSHDLEALLRAEAHAIALAQADGRAQGGEASRVDFEELPPEQLEAALSSWPGSWVLAPDALAHLDDCHAVASMGHRICLVCLAGAVVAFVGCGVIGGRRAAGTALVAGGVIALALFAAVALWALAGFSAMFETLHGLFFSQGTWKFPWDSLLICMYPQDFWVGMGCVWAAVSLTCAVAAVVSGSLLRRRS